MDFGSIRRNRVSQPSRRKTFSASNLSYISCNSVGKKTIYVTLPKDFGCEVNLEGRIVHIRKGGPAHSVGIMQLNDYLRIVDDDDDSTNKQELIKLQVTYGVLQVDNRPNCPLVIEIGNRSNTSLGIALTDSPDHKIEVASIQPGSLADRCGFIKPGDILTSVHIGSNETIPCSPYYTSYQIAQILRQLTSKNSSVTLTIVPLCEEKQNLPDSTEDIHSGGSDSTLTLVDRDHPSYYHTFDNCASSTSRNGCNSMNKKIFDDNTRKIEKVEEEVEENSCVLSMCLWKDRLYEDWGFSLVDQNEGDTESETDDISENKRNLMRTDKSGKLKNGATVYQIRPGGPAFVAGLRPSDRIIQINGRDVSQLESTMLVPILASLDDALNILISRVPNLNPPLD